MISLSNLGELTPRVRRIFNELQTRVQMSPCTVYSASGAITIAEGVVAITATSAAAMTIAAPTSAQNGTILTVLSTTNFAHTITFTGSTFMNGTSAAKTTATFTAYAGASVRFIAYEGKWYQSGLTAVTIS